MYCSAMTSETKLNNLHELAEIKPTVIFSVLKLVSGMEEDGSVLLDVHYIPPPDSLVSQYVCVCICECSVCVCVCECSMWVCACSSVVYACLCMW